MISEYSSTNEKTPFLTSIKKQNIYHTNTSLKKYKNKISTCKYNNNSSSIESNYDHNNNDNNNDDDNNNNNIVDNNNNIFDNNNNNISNNNIYDNNIDNNNNTLDKLNNAINDDVTIDSKIEAIDDLIKFYDRLNVSPLDRLEKILPAKLNVWVSLKYLKLNGQNLRGKVIYNEINHY